MIINDIVTRLYNAKLASTLDMVEAVQPIRGDDLPVGQSFRGNVGGRIPDGGFLVTIADKTIEMHLPPNVRSGDQLNLTLVAREPRLTFLLGDRPAGTDQPLRLSQAGHFIDTLLQQSIETPLRSTRLEPLLPLPPRSGTELAGPLAQAISTSGLFYESHQAQWVMGKRPLEILLQEPQAKLPALAQPQQGREQPALAAREDARSNPTTAPSSVNSPASSQTAQAPSVSSQFEQNEALRLSQPVHLEALPLVRQQLETLDGRQFTWFGQVWPNQWMEWTIGEYSGQDIPAPETRSWKTQLKLNTPSLGEIEATLYLNGSTLSVRIETPETTTAALLQQHTAALADMMSTAGLAVQNIAVNHHGEP